MLSKWADTFKLYNSYSQQKETFSPVEPGSKLVRIYVCGVTPYDTSHIGHALTALTFDTLHRYLEALGYTVKHVQNVTDVDDDIFKRANRDGVDYRELAQQWDEIYRNSLVSLNCMPFDNYVAASSKIGEIIEMVKGLVERGAAYATADGSVFFRASSFEEYGNLSHFSREELLEKARAAAEESLVDSPDNPTKESIMDFVLWQKSLPGEPKWDSPWGAGRPGWHIECSAIGLDQFGPQFEVHGGGADLLFPHHSSEIAQSETLTGKSPLVKYWMHVGMVHLGGEKMSKSLGNLLLVRDVLKKHRADALRLYLLDIHYREPLHYEDDGVAGHEKTVDLFEAALKVPGNNTGPSLEFSSYVDEFYRNMNDDLNTPGGIAVAAGLAEQILELAVNENIEQAQQELRQMLHILGLFLAEN
jgi:L-cysteine:1D-myo-inositol 2-amino-2-deoxy-alpha-D-glucopyranoside ligase